MSTLIAEAPHYCLQWIDPEHTILLLEVMHHWSLMYAIEMLRLISGLLKTSPHTAFDMIVSIDESAQVELRGFAFSELVRAIRSPSPNMGRVVFCGRYRPIYTLLSAIHERFHSGAVASRFTYVSSYEEALDIILGERA